jgi:hypothetical protein
LIVFYAEDVFTATTNAPKIRSSGSYMLRFYSPERATTSVTSQRGDVWSFGALCYEVCLLVLIGQLNDQHSLSRCCHGRCHITNIRQRLKYDPLYLEKSR